MTFEEIDKRFEKGEYKRPEKLDLDWKKVTRNLCI